VHAGTVAEHVRGGGAGGSVQRAAFAGARRAGAARECASRLRAARLVPVASACYGHAR
jgi:hypothetical protein